MDSIINEKFSLFKRKSKENSNIEEKKQYNFEELIKLEKEFIPIAKKILTKLSSVARLYISSNKSKIPYINGIEVCNKVDIDDPFFITICRIDLWKTAPGGNARDWYGSDEQIKLENFFYNEMTTKLKKEFDKMNLDIKAKVDCDGDWDDGLIYVDVDIDDFEKKNSGIFSESKFI